MSKESQNTSYMIAKARKCLVVKDLFIAGNNCNIVAVLNCYYIFQGFYEDGKVHKIIDENGKTYYALCHNCLAGNQNDKHFHFHCLKCKTISCMDQPPMPAFLP
jgi:Fe2+ or Zn2+ uptake regulation protein